MYDPATCSAQVAVGRVIFLEPQDRSFLDGACTLHHAIHVVAHRGGGHLNKNQTTRTGVHDILFGNILWLPARLPPGTRTCNSVRQNKGAKDQINKVGTVGTADILPTIGHWALCVGLSVLLPHRQSP